MTSGLAGSSWGGTSQLLRNGDCRDSDSDDSMSEGESESEPSYSEQV